MSFSTSNSDSRRYVVFLGVFTAPLLILLGLNFLFLRNAGELLSVEEILDRQQDPSQFCLYGTALKSQTFAYKMEGIRRTRPDVIALGSSRSLAFRERFFRDAFYNMGSSMTNLNEGLDVADGILTGSHPPKTVILSLDFWWFSEAFTPPVAYRPRQELLHSFEGYFLFKPFQWLAEGKITITDYVNTIMGTDRAEPCNIGILALKRRNGLAPDGSRYEPDAVTSLENFQDGVFDEVKEIHDGTGRYAYADAAHPLHVETLLQLIQKFRDRGIEVVVVLPPFPSSVVAAFQEEAAHYGVFDSLRNTLRDKNIPFFDATDPAIFGSSDCEFLDGVHGGDVAYARLVLWIDAERKKSGFPPIGNTVLLQKLIAENAGYALAKDPRVTADAEVDFLHMGCKK